MSSKSQMPPMPGATVMTDTLDFVKNLWGSMSVPGMSIPGITVPTLSIEELDKKISDLKAVEAWLNVNMSMLRGTIQGMEVQRGTIATLKSMGESFASAMKQPGANDKSLFESSPYASVFFQQAASAPSTPATATSKAGAKPAAGNVPPLASASTAAPMTNPAAWWNLLQDQFQQAVSTAMSTDPLAAGGGAGAGTGAAKAAAPASGAAAPGDGKAKSGKSADKA